MSTTTQRRTVTNHEPSWWLRCRLDGIPAGWEANGVRACAHLCTRQEDAVGVTALYRTDTLACPRCMDAALLAGAPDQECDRCHEHAEILTGIVYDTELAGMRLLVLFGLCTSCKTKEGL